MYSHNVFIVTCVNPPFKLGRDFLKDKNFTLNFFDKTLLINGTSVVKRVDAQFYHKNRGRFDNEATHIKTLSLQNFREYCQAGVNDGEMLVAKVFAPARRACDRITRLYSSNGKKWAITSHLGK